MQLGLIPWKMSSREVFSAIEKFIPPPSLHACMHAGEARRVDHPRSQSITLGIYFLRHFRTLDPTFLSFIDPCYQMP